MTRRTAGRLLLVGLVLAVSACGSATSVPKLFDRSLYEAAVFRPENLRRLKPVVPDANGEALVVTLKNARADVGPLRLDRPVWVTVVPELKDSCRKFPKALLAVRLRQVLGLQPQDSVTHFVTFKVRVIDLFRPTPDPRTDTEYPCLDPVAKTGCNVFPKDVDPKHKEWMADTFLTLQIPNGYPWTHLGYTYNWAPGADPYGTSEYLIRGGSNVVVTETTPIADYCR